jgi:hypothetical protein
MSSPEIERSCNENRDLTESEKLSFGLSELALQVRAWLAYTKAERDKEGLDCDYYADISFPVTPNYPMFEVWADILERATAEIRSHQV